MIATVLDGEPRARQEAMVTAARQLEAHMVREQATIERLRAGARSLDEAHIGQTVVVVDVPAMRLCGLTGDRQTLELLFEQVAEVLDGLGADRSLPIARFEDESGSTAVAGYLSAAPSAGVEVVELPAATVASVLHRGSMGDIGCLRDRLDGWLRTHHPETRRGAWRYVFHESEGDDQSGWLVELQRELHNFVGSRVSGLSASPLD